MTIEKFRVKFKEIKDTIRELGSKTDGEYKRKALNHLDGFFLYDASKMTKEEIARYVMNYLETLT